MPFFDINNTKAAAGGGNDNSQPPSLGSAAIPNPQTEQTPTLSAANQNQTSTVNNIPPQNDGNSLQVNNTDIPSDLDLMFTPGSPTMSKPSTAIPGMNMIPNPLSVINPGGDLQHRLSPNTTDIFTYLDLTEQKNASDLHFTVGYPPALRVDDELQYVGTEALTQQRAEELFRQITTKEQFEKYLKERELDFSFNNKSGNRFRVNYYWDRGYMAAALRLIPGKIKSVEELGLPAILYEFAKYPHGLILLTGPTGSGKSTTIAAMLNEINMNQAKHIITVEDPIEYVYPRGKAIINQREVEKDTLSWTRALKYTLRQDPDVVLVGEMRDYETIASAITVSETGHLVFATLHTNSASQTIDRIIDVFPAHQQAQIRSQLASVLVAVISQRLIPLTRGGRKASVEILIGTSAVKNAIRENKTYQIDNIIQTSAEVGMIPLEKSLAEMVKSGDITLETALEYTSKPDQLKDLLR